MTRDQRGGRKRRGIGFVPLIAMGVIVTLTSLSRVTASADDDCLQAAIELEQAVLGDSVPEDPSVLRQRNEEFESKWATLCPEAAPSEVVLDPSESAPFVPEEGIFSPAEDILAIYSFTNYWVGQVDGSYYQVNAGSLDADSKQGGVVVMPFGGGPGAFIPSPTASGTLTIEASEGPLLTLASADGSTFTFDVVSQSFLAEPSVSPAAN